MSLIQWNIRGIKTNKEQVRILFREANVKAVCLQETKLGNESINMGVNYTLHRSPPCIGEHAHGGTGFVVLKSINHKLIHLDSILQACAIQIYTDRWITLCSLYLEPNLEERLIDELDRPRHLALADLQNLVDQLPPPFILMGDFNARHTQWGESTCSRWGNIIEKLVDDNDLIIMNDGSPTRYDVFHNTSSAIDLTICSSSLVLDYQWSVDRHLHGSDHFPIHLKYVKNQPSPCLPKWKCAEADWRSYNRSLKLEMNKNHFSLPTDAYDYLTNMITEKASEYIPKTSGNPRRPVVPWWSKECADSRKNTRACYHKYRRTPSIENRLAYCKARAKQNLIIKEAKRESFKNIYF